MSARSVKATTGQTTVVKTANPIMEDVRAILRQARQKAYAMTNFLMVEAYWKIGRRIVQEEQDGKERAVYGTNLVPTLARALGEEFGRGLSVANLWNFRQFYLTFPTEEILYALRRELSWTHWRLLIRVENASARDHYAREAADQGWSTRTLERHIATRTYDQDVVLMAEERLPVRCQNYDYSTEGAYFITICVKGREPVFGTVEDDQMVHSEAGDIACRCLMEIPRHYPNVTVDTAVVMPDHVHAILAIESSDPTVPKTEQRQQTESVRQRTRPLETLPLAVGSYKSSVTRLVRASGNTAFQWQKSYHDRVIRDWMEQDRIRAYIADNPRRWTESHGAQL